MLSFRSIRLSLCGCLLPRSGSPSHVRKLPSIIDTAGAPIFRRNRHPRGENESPLFSFSRLPLIGPELEETGSVLSNAAVLSHMPLFRQNLRHEKENAIITNSSFLFSEKCRTGGFQPFYDTFEIPACFGRREHPSSIRLPACRIRRCDTGAFPSFLLRRRGSGRQENVFLFPPSGSFCPSSLSFPSSIFACSLPKTLPFISEGVFSFSFRC